MGRASVFSHFAKTVGHMRSHLDEAGRASSRRRRTAPAVGARGARLRDEPEPPLRAELYSIGQLERHARSMAGWHEVAPAPGRRAAAGADRLLARLDENEVVFRDAYGLITERVRRGRQITPAAEWFIDNHYLIEDQIRTARRHLPRAYGRELPRLAGAQAPGRPRVYDLALELISHSHGRVDAEGLAAFIAAYQAVQPLRLGELWAIPIMLRLALLENLRRVVASVTAGRHERERAAHWVDAMIEMSATDPASVVLVLAEMVRESPPLTDAFVAELAVRLQGQGSALVFPLTWLEHRLAEQGQTVDHVYHLASQSQAADQVSVGNSIGSLRFLSATDWRDFVESMSVVETTLRQDPADAYASMDFATRDRYRHAVETIARRGALSEDDVARTAIDLAGEARRRSPIARAAHVGHFLVDEGRPALDRAARVRPTPAQRLRGALWRSRHVVYAGAVVLVTALLTALLAAAAPIRP